MVKADPSRNYYADLKVAATANENEIRKAFRTLALQYHPDRNPGREAEFVTKFQEIQAAHEILTDHAQRTKYDSDRRRHRGLNVPTDAPNTPRTRPPPRSYDYTTTTPRGSYYRAPPPKPTPQTPQRPPPPQQRHSAYTSNAYTSGADKFTSRNFRPQQPPTAQRPEAKPKEAEGNRANVFTAWQKMNPRRAQEAQQHNAQQNSSAQNNLNNPNGAPFGRSQSTRVPSSKYGFNPATPGADEGQARSAYKNYARPAPTPPNATTPPHPSPSSGREVPGTQAPYSEANRVRTPYYNNVAGERTSMFDGIGRSASVRNSPTHSHRPSPSNDAGSFSDGARRRSENMHNGKTTMPPFPHMYADSSDEESETEGFRPPPPKQKTKSNPQKNPRPDPPLWGQAANPSPGRPANTTTGNMPNSFKSRSEESINMKFSPSDWHGKFEGSADYFTPNISKTSNKGRVSPTRGRQTQRNATERAQFSSQSTGQPQISPFSGSQYPIPPPPPGPPPNKNFPPPPQNEPSTKFKPEQWADTFKDAKWVYSDVKPKETSPRRASEAAKRPKAARKASVPQNGTAKTQTQSESAKPAYQAFAEEPSSMDGDAMDIDPSTPPVPMTSKKGARTASGTIKLDTSTAKASMPNGSSTAPPSTTTAKPPGPGLNGLSGIANVEPFLPNTGSGIALDGLKDTLPFPSQAAAAHPTKANTAQKLKFPDMPIAPPTPGKVDVTSAETYFNRMGSYVKAYKIYSKAMTEHFNARNRELEEMDDHFIKSRGETTKKVGFASYLAKMKEDEEVMETWKLAQERHLEALQQCETVRNKAKKMQQSLHG